MRVDVTLLSWPATSPRSLFGRQISLLRSSGRRVPLTRRTRWFVPWLDSLCSDFLTDGLSQARHPSPVTALFISVRASSPLLLLISPSPPPLGFAFLIDRIPLPVALLFPSAQPLDHRHPFSNPCTAYAMADPHQRAPLQSSSSFPPSLNTTTTDAEPPTASSRSLKRHLTSPAAEPTYLTTPTFRPRPFVASGVAHSHSGPCHAVHPMMRTSTSRMS